MFFEMLLHARRVLINEQPKTIADCSESMKRLSVNCAHILETSRWIPMRYLRSSHLDDKLTSIFFP